jgi:hypothetical protein
MNNNLLIGAISGNYTVENIKRWVETSEWEDVDRVLLVYNQQDNPKTSYIPAGKQDRGNNTKL